MLNLVDIEHLGRLYHFWNSEDAYHNSVEQFIEFIEFIELKT